MGKLEFDWGEEFTYFLNSLNNVEKAKILSMIRKVEQYGIQVSARQQWVKKLESNLYEIRTRTNETFLRGIYFQIKDNHYYLTHGFKKKKNKTPEREILKAKKIRGECNEQN